MLKSILRTPFVLTLRTIIQSAHTSVNHPRRSDNTGDKANSSDFNKSSSQPFPAARKNGNNNTSLQVRQQPRRYGGKTGQSPNRHENLFQITSPGNNRSRVFRGVVEEDENQRTTKRFMLGGKSDDLPDELSEADPERLVQYEEELDMYARDENSYHAKIVDEDIQRRKRAKMGIIQKRVNKIEDDTKHTNTNLLTWDAKEQIKYLNLNFPDEWDITRIVESFPITADSCRKLLRSKWAPRTLEELIRHDNKAIENWKEMCGEDKSDYDGPAINIYEEYKKLNKLNLMKHAMGMPGVEFTRSKVFSDSYSFHENLLVKPGKFSSLIKRDTKVMQLLNKKSVDEVQTLTPDSNTSAKSLDDHLTNAKAKLDASLAKLFSEKPSSQPPPPLSPSRDKNIKRRLDT